ncbi:MAG: ribonuclease R family protein [Eubacteriales bacterium]
MNTKEYIEKTEKIISDPLFRPITAAELAGLIGVPDSELESYAELIHELQKAGVVGTTKRGKVAAPPKEKLTAGTFRGTSKGYGFVTPDAEHADEYKEDIFIPAPSTGYALDGDKVLFRIKDRQFTRGKEHFDKSKFKRGRNGKMIPIPEKERGKEGEIVKITERALASSTIIGTFFASSEKRGRKIRRTAWVQPDMSRLPYSILVDASEAEALGASVGDKVEAKITVFPSDKSDLVGKILRVFGDSRTRKANYEAILAENGIEMSFPEEVTADAEKSAARKIMPDGRLDLRSSVIFTIDGADAKDLDDAISLEKDGDGYRLGVHIADVSEYVSAGSPSDLEAMHRGTSVYFADKVVPMLPKCLSNGACSLGGGLERYALSAFISLSPMGEITDVSLHESIICSRVRGVYDEVNDLFEKGSASDFADKYKEVLPSLTEMRGLYKILKNRSEKRGAVELETAEAVISVGRGGDPTGISLRERGDAEKMIEQFMLCANEGVATYLTAHSLPCVYRIHEAPSPEKLEAFSAFLSGAGIDTSPLRQDRISGAVFSDILRKAREKGLFDIVSGVMLRAMMKAKYSSVLSPHFGLGTDIYCHFTSPIRRYPDLSVHRIVKEHLHGTAEGKNARLSAFAAQSAAKSSENELRALNAEREIEELYKAVYMSDKIGEVFDGVISSVTSFGLFVSLANTVEGLIPLERLDGRFSFDERHFLLTDGKTVYRLGQSIKVCIEQVDISSRRITMSEA